MAIPLIQLPFGRVRVVTKDYEINSFADLPNAFIDWKPRVESLEDSMEFLRRHDLSVVIKNGVPTTNTLRIHLQIDRFYRRAEAGSEGYIKQLTKAVSDLVRVRQWKEEFGEGTLDCSSLNAQLKNYSRAVSRITCGMISLPGGQREMRNFIHLGLDREAYFCTTSDDAPIHKNETNAIYGKVVSFGDEMRCVVNHPFLDLRKHFTREKIEGAILDKLDNQFPWMEKHNLLHTLELDM